MDGSRWMLPLVLSGGVYCIYNKLFVPEKDATCHLSNDAHCRHKLEKWAIQRAVKALHSCILGIEEE